MEHEKEFCSALEQYIVQEAAGWGKEVAGLQNEALEAQTGIILPSADRRKTLAHALRYMGALMQPLLPNMLGVAAGYIAVIAKYDPPGDFESIATAAANSNDLVKAKAYCAMLELEKLVAYIDADSDEP